jgi:hypothetical protein
MHYLCRDEPEIILYCTAQCRAVQAVQTVVISHTQVILISPTVPRHSEEEEEEEEEEKGTSTLSWPCPH